MRALDEPTALVLRYYLFMATSTIGSFIAVWIILLEGTRGFSFTAIMALDAVFFTVIVLAEVPTGYVGDRLGRRNALLVGAVISAGAAVAFGFVRSVPAFAVVFGVWGFAITLRSGNDSAWLYDALAAQGTPERFGRVRGRGLSVFLLANAATAVLGGWLFELHPSAPFVATGAFGLLSAGVLLTMPEARGSDEAAPFGVGEAKAALLNLFRPELRWFVAFTAAVFAIGWSADLFVQPIAVRAGITPSGVGTFYAGLMLAAAAGSAVSAEAADRLGVDRLVLASPFVLGAMFLAVGVAPLAVIPAFVGMRVVLNLVSPVAETYLNDRTPSLGRATVLSGWSMAFSLVTVPVKLASGPVADAVGPSLAVAALGALLIGVAGAIALGRRGRVVEGSPSGPSAAAVERT